MTAIFRKTGLSQFAQSTLRTLELRSAFVFFAILFRLALEFGYSVYVSPIHAHSGFPWSPDVVKYGESWFLYFLLVILAPHRLIKPSDCFVVLLLFGLIAPLLSLYGLADASRQNIYIVISGYSLVCFFRKGRPLRFPIIVEGPLIAIVALIAGAIAVTAWFVVSGGISYFNLDLTEVYEYRRDAGDVINVGLMGYMNTWAYKVFGPALLALAVWRKIYWLAALVIALHVFWFGVSAHKAVLFYPFLVLFLWFWFRKTQALSVIPVALTGVVVVATLVYLVFDYGLPASLFVRRAFYVLANNTFDYYEYFSANKWVWWSNSVTSSLLDYPYHVNPALLIGEWRGTESHVNNSFLSTGFMHAGVVGVILYGILAGTLFRIIDSLSANSVPVWVALSVLIVPSRSLLLSADLPTALLTHGIAAGMVTLFFLRSTRGSDVRIEKARVEVQRKRHATSNT